MAWYTATTSVPVAKLSSTGEVLIQKDHNTNRENNHKIFQKSAETKKIIIKKTFITSRNASIETTTKSELEPSDPTSRKLSQTRSITTPPLTECQSIASLLPAFG